MHPRTARHSQNAKPEALQQPQQAAGTAHLPPEPAPTAPPRDPGAPRPPVTRSTAGDGRDPAFVTHGSSAKRCMAALSRTRTGVSPSQPGRMTASAGTPISNQGSHPRQHQGHRHQPTCQILPVCAWASAVPERERHEPDWSTCQILPSLRLGIGRAMNDEDMNLTGQAPRSSGRPQEPWLLPAVTCHMPIRLLRPAQPPGHRRPRNPRRRPAARHSARLPSDGRTQHRAHTTRTRPDTPSPWPHSRQGDRARVERHGERLTAKPASKRAGTDSPTPSPDTWPASALRSSRCHPRPGR